jgi:hypothetical protein
LDMPLPIIICDIVNYNILTNMLLNIIKSY